MKFLSLSLLLPFLCSVATTSASIMSDSTSLDEGQLAEIELRRQAGQSSKLDCEQVKVLLTHANVAANKDESETPDKTAIKAFDRQGGVVPLSDPNDAKTIIGDYSFLVTFLNSSFGCLSNGAYTFLTGDQITFTASCSGLPFFSITGGRGKYSGAEGFVEFLIPVEDGSLHEINICSFSDSNNEKSEQNRKSKKGKN